MLDTFYAAEQTFQLKKDVVLQWETVLLLTLVSGYLLVIFRMNVFALCSGLVPFISIKCMVKTLPHFDHIATKNSVPHKCKQMGPSESYL